MLGKARPIIRLVVGLVALCCASVSGQIVTTVVGTSYTFPGNGKAALAAPLGSVGALAIAPDGTVYIGDSYNYAVFKIDQSGLLTTVAGNGVNGFSGDGGPAIDAAVYVNPVGLALGPDGSLYIADNAGHVRRVDSRGIITTVAGGGVSSADGVLATSAGINPSSITVSRTGVLYIADRGSNSVRAVTTDGKISTVAGGSRAGSTATLNPFALATDNSGNLFISSYSSPNTGSTSLIYKLAPSGAFVLFAGGGTAAIGKGGVATNVTLGTVGMTTDALGNLYLAEYIHSAIFKITPAGTITTVAGIEASGGYSGDGGPATQAQIAAPSDVGLDSLGNLYIADLGNGFVRKVNASGIISTVAGTGLFRSIPNGTTVTATSASLYQPWGITLDGTGNLFISDTQANRVYKVTSAGQLSTLVGNGSNNDLGQTSSIVYRPGGVATDGAGNVFISNQFEILKVSTSGVLSWMNAPNPNGLALDPTGNIYFTSWSPNSVQKIDTSGKISTIFSGTLSRPGGIARDTSGNLYVADMSNNRVVKITPGGNMTVVAGTGTAGGTGDGGPAITATLNSPYDVKLGPDGAVYIADSGNCKIRRVASNGIITTFAGFGGCGFSGDGGPATQAQFGFIKGNPPVAWCTGVCGLAFDAVGNLFVADTGSSRIREILAAPPAFVNPAPSGGLGLSGISGGRSVSANLSVATQTSTLNVPGLGYTATTSGGSWLSVSPQTGSTPGLATVKADPLNLQAGSYTGIVTFSVPNANPTSQTVTVNFTVAPGVPASLSVDKVHMSFTYATASPSRQQTVIVSNSGGGSMPVTTSVSLDGDQSVHWLSVTPASAAATPSSPVPLAVTADPSNLQPGTYTGSVKIAGGAAGSAIIPVAMTVTTNPLILLLSQTGLTFTAVQSGGVIPPQTFGVLNLGSGTLNWTVETSTLSGGNWLLATPGSGSSDAGNPGGAPLVSVSVSTTNMAAGVYYGLVRVRSTGAANTPQEVVAVLRVLPAGTDVAPIVQPNSLIFRAVAGGSSPGSQDVLVYDPTGTAKSFRSGIVTTTGGNWIVTLPGDATIAPDRPTRIVVQPLVDNLKAGTYHGTLTLQFSDGRVSAVGVTFVVQAAGTTVSGLAARTDGVRPFATSSNACTPTQLLPSLISLGPGFSIPAGYPHGLEAQVVDDCGNLHQNGSVLVEFSNGDSPVKLSSLNNGRWDGTWKAGSQQVSQVTLKVTAQNPQLLINGVPITGQNIVTGGLGTPQPAPEVKDGGVVSAASFSATPLAPGGMLAIFGSGLSDGALQAPSLPLPQALGSTIVTIGDQIVPLLYASDTQVNGVVPFGVNVNTNQQLLVQRGTTYATTPAYVDVAAAQPAVFQAGQQAIIVDLNGNLINSSNPAHGGDVILIFCTGLGMVSNPPADGAADQGAAATVNPVTVAIGGQDANVGYAGLTPGFAGLYQINVTVPQGTVAGDQVPIAVGAAGQTGTGVQISVR